MTSKTTPNFSGMMFQSEWAEQVKIIDESFAFNLRNKYRVIENLFIKLLDRGVESNNGLQGIQWFFESQLKMIKSFNDA